MKRANESLDFPDDTTELYFLSRSLFFYTCLSLHSVHPYNDTSMLQQLGLTLTRPLSSIYSPHKISIRLSLISIFI